jgi:hypothetical protein
MRAAEHDNTVREMLPDNLCQIKRLISVVSELRKTDQGRSRSNQLRDQIAGCNTRQIRDCAVETGLTQDRVDCQQADRKEGCEWVVGTFAMRSARKPYFHMKTAPQKKIRPDDRISN